jgi:hypothetical protein
MDKHLSILAKQHVETRFVKVHAEKAPFLTEKLRIVVLPTLALVKNTKVEDYVVRMLVATYSSAAHEQCNRVLNSFGPPRLGLMSLVVKMISALRIWRNV